MRGLADVGSLSRLWVRPRVSTVGRSGFVEALADRLKLGGDETVLGLMRRADPAHSAQFTPQTDTITPLDSLSPR